MLIQPALGRPFQLGGLYDARKHQFLPSSPGDSNLLQGDGGLVTKEETISEANSVEEMDDFTQRSIHFNLDSGTRLSVLSGLVAVKGAASYLVAQRALMLTERIVYYCHKTTHTVSLNIDSFNEYNRTEISQGGDATHVCAAIEYGAQAVITFEQIARDEVEASQARENLKACVRAIAGMSVDENGRVDIPDDIKDRAKSVKVVYFGDIVVDGTPSTFEDVCRIIKSFPSLVAEVNAIPIRVHLSPLSAMNVQGVPLEVENFQTLEDDPLMAGCESIMGAFAQVEQDVQECIAARACRYYPVLRDLLWEMDGLMRAKRRDFMQQAVDCLTKLRSGHAESHYDLEDLVFGILESPFAPTTLMEWMHERRRTTAFLESVISATPNVETVWQDEALATSLEKCSHALILRVYMGTQGTDPLLEELKAWPQPPEATAWVDQPPALFDFASLSSRKRSFMLLAEANAGCSDAAKAIVLRCSAHDRPLTELTIETAYMDRQGVWHENYEPHAGIDRLEFISASHEGVTLDWRPVGAKNDAAQESSTTSADDQIEVQWREAGGISGDGEDGWQSQTFQFEDGLMVYGLKPVTEYIFRARMKTSVGATRFCPELAAKTTFRLREEYNVLLLGSTGVGKSTFINAFVNYLAFASLDEAKAKGLKHVLPASFTVSQLGASTRVVIGKPEIDGEALDVVDDGESCTQHPKAYVVTVTSGDVEWKIRWIDTPGIGDPRGIDQDTKNMQAILHFLSHHTELHAILFLLKPNDSRLEVSFKYCIKELLKNLHRDAVRILMFVFTNSRQTFYEPGDTLPVLRKLLSGLAMEVPTTRDTMFCIDSESFRYLAARNQGVEFADATDDDFKKSWNRSVATCRRLVHQMKTLGPHRVRETATLNEARQQILLLAEPLARINKDIETKKAAIQGQRSQLDVAVNDETRLRELLMADTDELHAVDLEQPRTVCTHQDCSSMASLASGEIIRLYTTHCHEMCYVKGVPLGTLNDVRLTACWAFNGGRTRTCRNCQHDFQYHYHVAVEYQYRRVRREDATIARELEEVCTIQQRRQEVMQRLEQELLQHEEEQRVVVEVSAKFAHFLANCGILSINDAVEDYIRFQIIEQKDIIASLRRLGGDTRQNEAVISGLEKQLSTYHEELRMLKELQEKTRGGSGTSDPVTLDGVMTLIRDLEALPLNGPKITEAKEAHSKANARAHVQYNEVFIQPRNRGSSASAYRHCMPYGGGYGAPRSRLAHGGEFAPQGDGFHAAGRNRIGSSPSGASSAYGCGSRSGGKGGQARHLGGPSQQSASGAPTGCAGRSRRAKFDYSINWVWQCGW